MQNYYVYMLTNAYNKVLYIGITNDIEKRLSQHRQGTASTFTRKYNAYKLVYVEHYPSVNEALVREKQLKGWRREKKDALVNGANPAWGDISANWR